ncbi:SAM-dependent methyltransferase [Acidimangrovimonas sediminis]|uniref:SAM-dependent methyltransferase n=1 Tax=Acidimangrovimonas sediminis TaxID=2056283 RepID=UPI000C80512A|nr:cyclopropane-fatty-acyl-phospholipid synthase family protein [Acidimangrovimonas sediminis]
MWTGLLDRMLSGLVRKGSLVLHMPDGKTLRHGDGGLPSVTVKVTDPDMARKMVMNPDMALGEGYTDGTIQIENDDLYGLLTLALQNIQDAPKNWRNWTMRLQSMKRMLDQFNPTGRSKRNVAHHYDLSGKLYDLFLDSDRQYSCAYFREPTYSLEEAQEAKKHHIAKKLLIEPGMTVLDIGCGWGGLGLTLARDYGAKVLGVTLSEEQHKIAVQRAKEAGLEDRLEFRLCDYRNVQGKFDRIVSVGMFEHVGVPQYRTYFRTIYDRLAPDGVALVHTIGRPSPPGTTSPWILKYIFPGGYCPALSETMATVEKEQLYTTDVEVWRLHYAETLRHWHDRFMARVDEAKELYDERFCRMWRFYLVACELTFRYNDQCVFQIQLAHKQEAVPLTRDYLYKDDGPANDMVEVPQRAEAAE